MAAYTIRLLNSQYERHIVVEGSRVTDGIFSPVSLKQEDFKAAVDGLFYNNPKTYLLGVGTHYFRFDAIGYERK